MDSIGPSPRLPDSDLVHDEALAVPLSAQEAQAWRSRQPPFRPWLSVGVQIGAVLVMTLLAALLGPEAWAVSVAWGGACAAIPSTLFARALRRVPERAPMQAGAVLMRLLVWEFAKVVLTVVMLMLSPRVVSNLDWLALVLSFVATMKVSWVVAVCALRSR